jgi:hypothetical protein
LTNDFDAGLVVGGYGFLEITPNVLCGLRIAYDHWNIGEGKSMTVGKDLTVMNAGGDYYMMEIMPTLRLATYEELSPVNIFGQFGAGPAVRTVAVQGTGLSGKSVRTKPFDQTDVRVGFQAGPGVSVGDKTVTVEVLSLYHVLFETEKTRKRYITFTLGLSFRFP